MGVWGMYRAVDRLARALALLGGIVLSALIVLTCASVAGRMIHTALNSDLAQGLAPQAANALLATGVGPVQGDFELVEAGMAFAIFAFLPLCQLHGAHASVDIFTRTLPAGVQRTLRLVADIALAAVIVLIAWQLYLGMASKLRSGQTTYLLEYPVWWGYAASLACAVPAALVALYVAAARAGEMATGRTILAPEQEAGLAPERDAGR